MLNDGIWILYDLLHNLLKPVVRAVDVNGRPVYASGKPYLAASVVEGAREELYAIWRRLEAAEEPQTTEARPTITPEIMERAAGVEELFRFFKRYHGLHLGPAAVQSLAELGAEIGRLNNALKRELTIQSEEG